MTRPSEQILKSMSRTSKNQHNFKVTVESNGFKTMMRGWEHYFQINVKICGQRFPSHCKSILLRQLITAQLSHLNPMLTWRFFISSTSGLLIFIQINDVKDTHILAWQFSREMSISNFSTMTGFESRR